MKLRVFFLLSAALAATSIQAVVQPGRNQQLFNHNRDGYRYNGPAHKYLPAEGPSSTEPGIITGPWQSHGSHGNQIPESLEQGYNGPYNSQHYGQGQAQEQQRQEGHSWQQEQPTGQQQHQQQQQKYQYWQSFQGHVPQQQRDEPWQSTQGHGQQQQQYHQQQQSQSHQQQGHREDEYSPEQQGRPGHGIPQQEPHPQRAEYWQSSQQQPHNQPQEQQQQSGHWQPSNLGHSSDTFPLALAHASSHKTVAAPARDFKLVPAYTLSSYSGQDRFIGLDALDARLVSQSLPEAYQRVPFNAARQPGQSQRPEELLGGSAQQQQQQQGKDFVQMQSHSYQLPSSHSMERDWPQQQQHSGNRQYSASAFAFSNPDLQSSSPGILSSNPSIHSSNPSIYSSNPSYSAYPSIHSSNPSILFSNPSIHSSNPSYSSNPSSHSSQNSLSHPSREFQPPYYR